MSLLLNGMLDHSFRERSVRKTQGKQLVAEVLKAWRSLRSWWEGDTATPESKTATLVLLSKLLQVPRCCESDPPPQFTPETSAAQSAQLVSRQNCKIAQRPGWFRVYLKKTTVKRNSLARPNCVSKYRYV